MLSFVAKPLLFNVVIIYCNIRKYAQTEFFVQTLGSNDHVAIFDVTIAKIKGNEIYPSIQVELLASRNSGAKYVST